jgi:mannose-6-phosphate isomerase-like protein (cupin superfamily)
MKAVKARKCRGVEIPVPHHRIIKVLFAPDKENVSEATLSEVAVFPGGKTHYHSHNRSEFIYIISGKGLCECDGKAISLEQGIALYIEPGEKHMLVNTYDEPLRMVTFFVPAYSAKELCEACTANKEET